MIRGSDDVVPQNLGCFVLFDSLSFVLFCLFNTGNKWMQEPMYVNTHTYACTVYVSVCEWECNAGLKVATCTTEQKPIIWAARGKEVTYRCWHINTYTHTYVHTHIHTHTIQIHKERTGKERMIKTNFVVLGARDYHIPCKTATWRRNDKNKKIYLEEDDISRNKRYT